MFPSANMLAITLALPIWKNVGDGVATVSEMKKSLSLCCAVLPPTIWPKSSE